MASIFKEWPTAEEPSNLYKYTGVELSFGNDLTIIERQTYSVLEWLGDVGGLFDALLFIGASIVTPITTFTLRVALVQKLYREGSATPNKISNFGSDSGSIEIREPRSPR